VSGVRMIDRVSVSPCWTRNLSHHSSTHPQHSSSTGNCTSSPGSSSILTMESLDSLEGFESETPFSTITSRPSMAELMGTNHGGGSGRGDLMTPNLTSMSLTHGPIHSMSPTHLDPNPELTRPCTPSSVYGGMGPGELGLESISLIPSAQHQLQGNAPPGGGAGPNVPEYPWMKEKKTTRKNSHQGGSKWGFPIILFTSAKKPETERKTIQSGKPKCLCTDVPACACCKVGSEER